MTATDQIRTVLRDLEAKAKELELDKKLTTFADSADTLLREAAARAGEYAAENRERVEGALDRAEAAVDSRTEGKYHRTVDKVKAGVLSGVDWVVEQRDSAPRTTGTSAGDADATPPAGSADTPWVDVTDVPGAPAAPPTPDFADISDDAILNSGESLIEKVAKAAVGATKTAPTTTPSRSCTIGR